MIGEVRDIGFGVNRLDARQETLEIGVLVVKTGQGAAFLPQVFHHGPVSRGDVFQKRWRGCESSHIGLRFGAVGPSVWQSHDPWSRPREMGSIGARSL